MQAYVGQKQLPAFFKFRVAGQRKNMKFALALQPNVRGYVNLKKLTNGITGFKIDKKV
jgi:hypothetical protein